MRTFETEILRHPQLKDFRRETIDKVLDLINACDLGKHDFSLLDQDPEALSCFRAIIWGPFVVPPPSKSAENPPQPHTSKPSALGQDDGGVTLLPGNLSQPFMSKGGIEPTVLAAAESLPVENGMNHNHPGPKPRGLPGDLINQLSQQGLSSREIAAALADRGFRLSYKSIQRYLKRQKQAILL